MEVTIKCSGSSELPLSALIPFQGELKALTKENYLKIKNSLLKNGFISPFHVWNNNILDGHQRLRALTTMQQEGISIPEKYPIVKIEAPDEKAAKKIILALSSQYGLVTEESLFEFSHELLGFEELTETFGFDAIDFAHYGENFFFEGEGRMLGHQNRGPNAEEKLEKYLEKGFQEIKLYYDLVTYQEITAKLDTKMAIEGLEDYSECIKRLLL